MNAIELRNLEPGKEYIVVYRKKEQWIPCVVKVVKERSIRFIRPKGQNESPLKFDKEYSIKDFWHECRGIDLFGQKFEAIWVFDNLKIAQAWCEFENSIVEYIENTKNY